MMNILLTGGSGFLGRFMVDELLSSPSPLQFKTFRIFDTADFHCPDDGRIELIRGDVRDSEALEKACRGIDLVIHMAAIVDWGTHPEEEVYEVNTRGTENVVNACLTNGVKALIFTSSLDAVFGGKALVNIDENHPVPDHFPNMYCRSKAEAEKIVLSANSSALKTAVLRPADIWGEGDPFHIGSLVEMAKGGFYVRLGDGSAKSQHVYAGNMARAHIQLALALFNGNPAVPGNVYFITDSEASNFFHFYDRIVEGAGYRIWPRNFWIPRGIAFSMGFLSEAAALMIRPFKKVNPKFSRFAVIYTCSDFTFSSDKAVRDFGFSPKYTEEESFKRTIEYYKRELE